MIGKFMYLVASAEQRPVTTEQHKWVIDYWGPSLYDAECASMMEPVDNRDVGVVTIWSWHYVSGWSHVSTCNLTVGNLCDADDLSRNPYVYLNEVFAKVLCDPPDVKTDPMVDLSATPPAGYPDTTKPSEGSQQ